MGKLIKGNLLSYLPWNISGP